MKAARLLKKARHGAGVSQRELADRSGVSQPAIARIESGRVNPTVGTLDRLLAACGQELRLTRKLGEGLDRTVSRGLLQLSPLQRAEYAVTAARNIERLRKATPTRTSTDAVKVLKVLVEKEVRFVLVGVFSGSLHGSNLVPRGFEICHERGEENVELLIKALQALRATPTKLGPGAGTGHAGDLSDDHRHSFDTAFGPLDCFATPPGVGLFVHLEQRADTVDLGGFSVKVAALDDLIAMCLAAGTPEELYHAEILGALREEIDGLDQD